MSAILKDPLLQIRQMRVQDLPAVMRNECAAYSHPWTEGIMRDCIKVGYHCQVCVLDQDITGHAVLSVGGGEAHLLNLCVAPNWQRKGLGRRLLARMSTIAAQRLADTRFLEVRHSNLVARELYESDGFIEVGRRPDYYPAAGGREDALIFAKPLLD